MDPDDDPTSSFDPGPPPPPTYSLSNPSDWTYLTEGASNTLYTYTGAHPYFASFLLRLRKLLPGTPTTQQLHTHLTTAFPTLTPFLPYTVLIPLAPNFTAQLLLPPGSRALDAADPHGLLIQDLTPGAYLGEPEAAGERWRDVASVEFKPKWLVQSANAPVGWSVCRTCAVRGMAGGGEGGYCPLDLVSGERWRVRGAVGALLAGEGEVCIADPLEDGEEGSEEEVLGHELADKVGRSLEGFVTEYFMGEGGVVGVLQRLQAEAGRRGVFTKATLGVLGVEGGEETLGEEVWGAMTLRDCSVFLRVWVRKREGRGLEAKVEGRVLDLDLKTGDGGRSVYWRDVERRLRLGGWYGGPGKRGRSCRTGLEEL